MSIWRAFLSIFFLLFIVSPVLKAGDSIYAPQEMGVSITRIENREPDQYFFTKYLADKDYAYISDYKPGRGNSFFDRLWRFITGVVKNGMSIFRYLPLLFRIILLCLFIVFLYIVFTKSRIYKLFYTDKDIPVPDFDEIDILDEEYDFEKAINSQLTLQNFRNAIRLLHLKILKELEVLELIRYSKEKTNRDYSREISDMSLRNTFLTLTTVYNRVWFGNYPLSRDDYGSLAAGFYTFSEKINAGKE